MKKIVFLIFILTGLICITSSLSALTLVLSAGPLISPTTITVADNSALDLDPTTGSIVFMGSIGSFTTTVNTTFSKPVVGSTTFPIIHLNSVVVSNASGGQLRIRASETGFSSTPFPAFITQAGGLAGGTILLKSFLDDSNTLLGTTTLLSDLGTFGPGAFSATKTSPFVFPTNPFSLTIGANINHSGTGTTSFDLQTSPAPEPSTVLLLGTGLLGVGVWRRRKSKKSRIS